MRAKRKEDEGRSDLEIMTSVGRCGNLALTISDELPTIERVEIRSDIPADVEWMMSDATLLVRIRKASR